MVLHVIQRHEIFRKMADLCYKRLVQFYSDENRNNTTVRNEDDCKALVILCVRALLYTLCRVVLFCLPKPVAELFAFGKNRLYVLESCINTGTKT